MLRKLLFFIYLPVAAGLLHAAPDPRSRACFVENKGQVRDQLGNVRADIDFRLSGSGSPSVFIGSRGICYQWVHKGTGEAWDSLCFYRLDLTLVGANPNAKPDAGLGKSYTETYYQPWAPADGVQARSFTRIQYSDVYPFIDWVLYFNDEGLLKYDFIVRPGGRASDIRMRYEGATALKPDSVGGLMAITPMGTISEKAPVAFVQDSRAPVAAAFRLLDGVLTFDVPGVKGTLVIDPVLQWGSYFGGADMDLSTAVACDPEGNVYLAGATSSLSNIATTGAHQQIYGGGSGFMGNDAYLAKFTAAGDPMWATYYGGTEEDVGMSLATDTTGAVYLSGYTAGSTGLATAGAFQPAPAGGYDAFLVKFNSGGQRLWGTFIGGNGDDFWGGPVPIACDGLGHIYLAGTAQSTGLATAGASQLTHGGYDDAVLFKFNNAGSRLWSTYLGGLANDYGFCLAADHVGNVILGGSTNSSAGITTAGSFQPVLAGDADGFFAKYSSAGALLWSTYFGGSAADYIRAVATDDSANIYLTGITASASGVATAGAYQSAYGGGLEDAFVARFTPLGQPVWSSYYGGGDIDEGLTLKVRGEALYLAGLTSSPAGIATPDGVQPVAGGDADGLVSRFDQSGNLVWGSYYGGTDWDQFTGLDIDTGVNLYCGGFTVSASGIATPGAYQPAYSGGYGDGFLLRIKDCALPAAADSILGPLTLCEGNAAAYKLPGASGVIWLLPSGWTGTAAADSIVVTAGASAVLRAVAVNECGPGDTVSLAITTLPSPAVPLITRTGNQLSVPAVYSTYQWLRDNVAIAGATASGYTVTSGGSYTVAVSGSNGCPAVSAPLLVDLTGISALLSRYGIAVFPNPVTDELYIRSRDRLTATIAEISGRVLQRCNIKPGENTIAVSGLAPGVYLLELYDDSGVRIGSLKLVKAP